MSGTEERGLRAEGGRSDRSGQPEDPFNASNQANFGTQAGSEGQQNNAGTQSGTDTTAQEIAVTQHKYIIGFRFLPKLLLFNDYFSYTQPTAFWNKVKTQMPIHR